MSFEENAGMLRRVALLAALASPLTAPAETLPPVDLILRLGVSLDKAQPRPSKAEMAAEISGLLRRLRRRLMASGDAPPAVAARRP